MILVFHSGLAGSRVFQPHVLPMWLSSKAGVEAINIDRSAQKYGIRLRAWLDENPQPDPEDSRMSDKSSDPSVMWQNFLGDVEKGFNSFANQTMGWGEFSWAMNQLTGTSIGALKALRQPAD